MGLICMKYRIIILIIIIFSVGQILLSYIANTSRMHACTHACTHACIHTRAHVQVIAIRWRPTMTARSAGDNAGRWPLKYTLALAALLHRNFGCFWHIKKFLAKLRRELVTGCTVSRYEQFETSLETIGQELRPAVCEHRQTDIRRILVYDILLYII